jgi:hypothetical protein
MESHVKFVIVLSVFALMAIVGIYYCVVRKLPKKEEKKNQ